MYSFNFADESFARNMVSLSFQRGMGRLGVGVGEWEGGAGWKAGGVSVFCCCLLVSSFRYSLIGFDISSSCCLFIVFVCHCCFCLFVFSLSLPSSPPPLSLSPTFFLCACVRACVHACVCVRVRVCVFVYV